jgi:hypothetical protein
VLSRSLETSLQPHLADVSDDHRSAAGQSGVVEADGALLGLPDQLREPPPVVDQRQIVATKLQLIKGERHRIAAPALAARRHESPALPSSPIVTTSPSIRHDAVLRRRAASTWQGSGRLVFCEPLGALEKHPLGLCLRTLLDRGLDLFDQVCFRCLNFEGRNHLRVPLRPLSSEETIPFLEQRNQTKARPPLWAGAPAVTRAASYQGFEMKPLPHDEGCGVDCGRRKSVGRRLPAMSLQS